MEKPKLLTILKNYAVMLWIIVTVVWLVQLTKKQIFGPPMDLSCTNENGEYSLIYRDDNGKYSMQNLNTGGTIYFELTSENFLSEHDKIIMMKWFHTLWNNFRQQIPILPVQTGNINATHIVKIRYKKLVSKDPRFDVCGYESNISDRFSTIDINNSKCGSGLTINKYGEIVVNDSFKQVSTHEFLHLLGLPDMPPNYDSIMAMNYQSYNLSFSDWKSVKQLYSKSFGKNFVCTEDDAIDDSQAPKIQITLDKN